MKAFRCPYCRQELGEKPPPTCPSCKRTMNLPAVMKRHPKRIHSGRFDDVDRPRQDNTRLVPTLSFTDPRQMITFGLMLAMLVVGGLMIGKAGREGTTSDTIRQKRDELAQRELNVLRCALELYKHDLGGYPTTEEGLKALYRNPKIPTWNHCYVSKLQDDPWRDPYVYRYTNDAVVLLSRGRDREEGTPDDLIPRNWETNLIGVLTNEVVVPAKDVETKRQEGGQL